MTIFPRPLVVVLGPTASGKTALGVFLAKRLGGEIVVCDSTQVYRGFDIGTGKPTVAERAALPHHLVDLCDPGEEFTAGDYLRVGRAVLAEISGRGHLSIVTAGTGLYLRALLEGLSLLPGRSPALRARLTERAKQRGIAHLHRLLQRVDPASAQSIGPRDMPKLVRALEVYFLARQPRTELFQAPRARLEGYSVLKLGLLPPREQLYERIEARVDEMLDAGWLEEVRRLQARYSDRAKPFGFLGYKQLSAHLRGTLTLRQAIKQTKHETRQFAKRQITWFRKEPGVRWLHGFGDEERIQREGEERVGALLSRTQAQPARIPSPPSFRSTGSG